MAEVTVWTPEAIEDARAKRTLLMLAGMQYYSIPFGGCHIGPTSHNHRQLWQNAENERWLIVDWPFGGFGQLVDWADVRLDPFRSLPWSKIHAFLQT